MIQLPNSSVLKSRVSSEKECFFKESVVMGKKYLVGSFLLAAFLLTSGINSADAAMSYEKALQYEQAHSEEVHSFTDKQKDIYGEKNKRRFIGLFGKNGLLHTGNTFAGSAQRTF